MDFVDAEGALTLASRIEAYWRRRGFDGIEAWIEQIPLSYRFRHEKCEGRDVYRVNSNIGGDGYPPRELRGLV